MINNSIIIIKSKDFTTKTSLWFNLKIEIYIFIIA